MLENASLKWKKIPYRIYTEIQFTLVERIVIKSYANFLQKFSDLVKCIPKFRSQTKTKASYHILKEKLWKHK